MKYLQPICLLMLFYFSSCNGQDYKNNAKQEPIPSEKLLKVGGAFENSEFTYIGIPATIESIDTSAAWNLEGSKLIISGTVYLPDGISPASDILIYYYHTNLDGKYVHVPGVKQSMPPTKQGHTHGFIRGWVKTDKKGQYKIYTAKPMPYPNGKEAAHIHLTIKEPGNISEYYIDSILFNDDPLLTAEIRKSRKNRGGSGILNLMEKEGLYTGKRDIILGLNIPDYPKSN